MRATLMTAGSILIAAELASAAISEGAPQRIATVVGEHRWLAVGYRTTRAVGSPIVNDTGESIGRLDDLIVTPGGKAPYAVLSVSGFLGVATRLVVVPTTEFDMYKERLVLHGATPASLAKLPGFAYTN